MQDTERDKRIETAWNKHLERCAKTQVALDAAAQAHAKIHAPSLEQYQAEYAEIWQEYNAEKG